MSPRRVLAITRRLLQQFRRDRRTLALVFLAPIVILTLLFYLLRGTGTVPKVDLVVEDGGAAGAAVAQQIERDGSISVTRTDLTTARSDLDKSRVAAYVLIPAGLSERLARERVLAPDVHLEGSEPGPAGTVLTAVQRASAGVVAQQAATGQPARAEPIVVYRYGGPTLDNLDYFGSAFIGFIVFFLVFAVTSVSFLRERSQGTLERLMASPLRRSELVLGYMLGFSVLALVQSSVVLTYALVVLHVHNAGNPALVFLVVAIAAIVAVNLGILLSTFAKTEFQAVQFIPLAITPQAMLAGIIFPVSSEPGPLQVVSNVLPLTYVGYALRDVMIRGAGLDYQPLLIALAVVAGFAVALIAAAGATVKRVVA